MMRYRVSLGARNDLLEIFAYWADRASVLVADRIIERVIVRFKLLGEHPHAGKSAFHIAAKVRCFPVGKYLIYYRKSGRFIDILHVFHAARNQAAAFAKSSRSL
jgi:toxin ParE1/3/4